MIEFIVCIISLGISLMALVISIISAVYVDKIHNHKLSQNKSKKKIIG
ncbi:hypothetical protein [Clostridium sp.]|nr:hypothetical protein [Clostridium sp.]